MISNPPTSVHTPRSFRGTKYDVIIVGARCAGSPLAMLFGRKGCASSPWTGPPTPATRFEQTDYGHPGHFNPWEPRGIDPALQPRMDELRSVCAALAPLLG